MTHSLAGWLLIGAVVSLGAFLTLGVWQRRKQRRQTLSQRRVNMLLAFKQMLGALTVLCLILAGIATYLNKVTPKEKLVAAQLQSDFSDNTIKVYSVGYHNEDWAQINFRDTVSMIASRGTGDDIKVGCMVEPNKFTKLTDPKLRSLFVELKRCPTNKELAAAK